MEPNPSNCKVSKILRFYLFITLLAGIAPLKFLKINNIWHVKLSKVADIYGKLIVMVICILASVDITSALFMEVRPFRLRTTADLVLVFTIVVPSAIGTMIASFTALDRMRNMITNFRHLEKINIQLYKINDCIQVDSKEWPMFVFVIFTLILGYFVNLAEYAIFNHQVGLDQGSVYSQSLHFFYYILIEYQQLIGLQFFLITSSVLFSFKLLNTCLKLMLKKICEENIRVHSKKYAPGALTQLASLYCSLCDVVQSLNDNNGVMMTMHLLVLFLTMIINCYCLLFRLFKGTLAGSASEVSDFYSGMLHFFWIGFSVLNLILVTEPCHRTHSETNVTKILLSKLMRSTSPTQHEINSELLVFYRHVMMFDAQYSPLKMFTLNRSLIASMSASITTYLVIVLTL